MDNKERKQIWKKLSDTFGFTPNLDGLSTAVLGKISLDILALDKMLNNKLPEYDSDNCIYKGKPEYSLEMVIKEHYGEETLKQVKSLL